MMSAKPGGIDTRALAIEGTLPSLSGAVEWLNSSPLTSEGLEGKVVLIDFWTYSCINCLRRFLTCAPGLTNTGPRPRRHWRARTGVRV